MSLKVVYFFNLYSITQHNCAWQAKIPTTLNRYNRICFHTPHLETESGYDYIQILDGSEELAKWSGTKEKTLYAGHGTSPLTYVKTNVIIVITL